MGGVYSVPTFVYEMEMPSAAIIGSIIGLTALSTFYKNVFFFLFVVSSFFIMGIRNLSDPFFNWWGQYDADNSKLLLNCTLDTFQVPCHNSDALDFYIIGIWFFVVWVVATIFHHLKQMLFRFSFSLRGETYTVRDQEFEDEVTLYEAVWYTFRQGREYAWWWFLWLFLLWLFIIVFGGAWVAVFQIFGVRRFVYSSGYFAWQIVSGTLGGLAFIIVLCLLIGVIAARDTEGKTFFYDLAYTWDEKLEKSIFSWRRLIIYVILFGIWYYFTIFWYFIVHLLSLPSRGSAIGNLTSGVRWQQQFPALGLTVAYIIIYVIIYAIFRYRGTSGRQKPIINVPEAVEQSDQYKKVPEGEG